MRSIYQYYDKNPQQEGHVDIIFVSNFAKNWVHFDTLIFYKNEVQSIDRGGCGWGYNNTYSLNPTAAVSYILAEDKKSFRKSYAPFEETRVRREDFHHRADFFQSFPFPRRSPFKFHRVLLTCNESEIDLSAEIPRFYVNRVAVWCPAYLCPKTGMLWDYFHETDREGSFSERFWLFKQLPKTRVIKNLNGGLEVERKTKVRTLYCESGDYDPHLFLSPTKTAFLSGKQFISSRHRRSEEIKDPRDFLLKQPKPPKFLAIKSAARYLRKRLRISPLRPSERKFFQMMGALAHIKKTINKNKIYAA